MILAAGRGKRLRPLTDTIPKPLVKVGPHSLIEHQIIALRAAGVTDIVINVCYLGDKIQQALGDGNRYDVNIHYLVEEEPALETGGGVLNALSILGDAAFIVTSADIVTDFPYQTLFNATDKKAYLILVANPDYHAKGDFNLLSNGQVSLAEPSFTYANIALLHASLFDGFKPGRFPLRDVLFPAIERGDVFGECYQGRWHNVGTLAELERVRC